MDIPKLLVAVVLFASAATATADAEQQSTPPVVGRIHRTVTHDVETRITWGAVYSRNGIGVCRARFMPQLEIVTAPAHGTVRFVTAAAIPHNSGCDNSVYGTAMMYRPNPGFVGQDQFSYNFPTDPTVMDWIGRGPGTQVVTVEVH
jgi:hypothetical protein